VKPFLYFSLFIFLIFSGCRHTSSLVNMRAFLPDIVFDIKYATDNNFTGERLYQEDKCYLHPKSAKKLIRVQKELALKGLGLKVFDGYRPLSVQKKLWDLVQDEKYVTPPGKGSSHCRGAGVDVTLVTAEGKEINLGTKYDEFTSKAYPANYDFPYEVLSSRILLKRTMQKYGFIQSTTEWWHFFDEDWKSYPVRDIRFTDL